MTAPKPQPPPLWQSLLGVADPTGPVATNLDKGLQQAGTSLGGLVPDIGTAITNAFKGLAGPITTWLSVKEASLLNTLNQLFNTAIYGGLALAGGLLCAWGLYEVGKDAGVDLGAPVKAGAGIASLLMPEARAAEAVVGAGTVKSVASEVAAPAPKKADAGGRENAARSAGLGAAQILRGRREDAAAK